MGWTNVAETEPNGPGHDLQACYRDQVPALFNFVCRLLDGDRHQAEDIVQETLLRYWRNYQSIGDEMMRPWLFTVARNLVIDLRRRKYTIREVYGTELDLRACEFDQANSVLSKVVIVDAFKALSRAHREVLYQTYFLDKSVEEAAKALNIPKGTVKSRVYYAMRSLQHALRERQTLPHGTSQLATGESHKLFAKRDGRT